MCCIVPNNAISLVHQFRIMKRKPHYLRIPGFLFFLALTFSVNAQHGKSACDVYQEIARMDSIVFTAFNSRDIEKFRNLFTEDLEFYHDKGGLTGYEHTIAFLKTLRETKSQLKRELVKGSLQVYCIKDYGAIQTGAHTFCQPENGKMSCATFKFMHVWKRVNNEWKIARVVSYDH